MANTSDEELTATHLGELRALLVEKRTALVRKTEVGPTEARGDQPDPMDAATDATDDEERVLLSERDRAQLREIDDALARLESGTYGVSERSGEPIGYARLRAVPWARLTVSEAEADERARR